MTIENAIKPQLLQMARRWNKRLVLEKACFHITRKREEELRSETVDWIEQMFKLFPGIKETDYCAIALSYMIEVKEHFIQTEQYLAEWYDGHYEIIINEEVIPEIKKAFLRIYTPGISAAGSFS